MDNMFEKEQLNSLVNSCQEEIRQLKKQLHEYKLITIDYHELEQERDKYKEVIDKLNNKINSLKTCEDKPKEDIIYPHWEICNETKQEMLDILKEVE